MKMKKYNFSAGPSILPNVVIKEAAKSVTELHDIGLSLLEISHRSNHFIEILNEAKQLTKELMNISDTHEILFLQGGASLQFYMSSLNFFRKHGGGYINTGTWSQKAIIESKKVCNTRTIASSEDKNYNYIPKEILINHNIDYLHFTSNNTIFGTQFHDYNTILNSLKSEKLLCDMSSDIFSKVIDVNNFDLIYAGAQKNIGPAGATLVIIKKNAIKLNKHLPNYLNYQTHIKRDSMFNTPPVFSIYVAMLTLRWIKQNGGVHHLQKKNILKANAIYKEIDRNNLFTGYTKKEDRSIMNATFNLTSNNKHLAKKFETMCKEAGINGIHGHRSVGGYRASMYNALDIKSVNILIEIMKQLEKKA